MNELVKAQTVKILDGMNTIANADMLKTGRYIFDEIYPERKKAICRGHKACAVGSLWLAGGIKPDYSHRYGVDLPGAAPNERKDFLRHRTALRMAYNALNEAAGEYLERHEISPHSEWAANIEALFESEDEKLDGDERRKAMLKVISSAKRKVKNS